MAILGNYRVYEKNIMPSQSGNGIVVLFNKSNSGKNIKITNVEINNFRKDTLGTALVQNDIEMVSITTQPSNYNKIITPTSLDTDNTTSGLNCYIGGNSTYDNGKILKVFNIRHGFFGATGNAMFSRNTIGDKLLNMGSVYHTLGNKTSSTEGFVLEQNTGLAFRSKDSLSTDAATMMKEYHTYLFEILVKKTTGSETFIFTDYFTIEPEGEPCFSIFNTSATNYTLLDVRISEVGDVSTPYFMFVPIDGIETNQISDTTRNLTAYSYDTSDPDLSSSYILKKDVVVIPKGFNSGLFLYTTSDSSQLPSKGLNYLITKDFLGPIYSAFFPEKTEYHWNRNVTVPPGGYNSRSHGNHTIFSGQDLYIRPGEGVAIVSSAEAMIIASGVPQIINKFSTGKYEYGISFSIEDVTVTLTLTGLQVNSEIRILEAGTTTELAGVENSSTSFTWDYVYTDNYYVDIVIHSLGYEYIRLTNVLLTTTGLSIPIQQRIDRNFLNP